jgi:glycosyltransferase involved in cell wall biosynthesis
MRKRHNSPLSVCFFAHAANPAGGADLLLLELVKELVKDYGVSCTVVVPTRSSSEKYNEAGAATVLIPYYWWCEFIMPLRNMINMRLFDSYRMLLKNIWKLKEIDPDIIISNTLTIPWGAVAAQLLNKPHVWYITEFGKAGLNLHFYLPFSKVLNIINQSSNLILTCSDAVKHTLFENQTTPDVESIYCYIDLKDAASNTQAQIFARTNTMRLIITGTITEQKGQKDAVLAVNELVKRKYDVELIIMGQASRVYIHELKELIKLKKLEPYVKIFPFTPSPYPLVNQADIVLVCSRNDAFGRVILEASLLKKPVVGANNGGTAELIKDGFNGLLYETGDYTQLADRIEYLIKRQDKIKELGENAYKYAKNTFTKERFGGKVYMLLTKLRNSENPACAALTQFLSGIMKQSSVINLCFKSQLWLFPIGTKRRRYYDLFFMGLSIIPNEGFINFLKRAGRYTWASVK